MRFYSSMSSDCGTFFQHWLQKVTKSLQCPQVKEGDILDSAVPGEKVEVQIAVKCALNPHAGHWSRWSQPVQEVVPQSAGVDYILRPHVSSGGFFSRWCDIKQCFPCFSDDISLMCYTSDLQNVICQWNGTRYGLEKEYKPFYRTALRYIISIRTEYPQICWHLRPTKTDFHIVRYCFPSKASSWSNWAECLADLNITDMCSFKGDAFQKLKVKLCSTASLLSRTFYTREFTMNTSSKSFCSSFLGYGYFLISWTNNPQVRVTVL